jgi:hypothetical protein
MFLRTVKVKGHAYVRLVESYRQNGKVKQRYITTIGSMAEFNVNMDYDIVGQIAGILNECTDLGAASIGTKAQKERMIRNRAEDLIESYVTRLKHLKVEHE